MKVNKSLVEVWATLSNEQKRMPCFMDSKMCFLPCINNPETRMNFKIDIRKHWPWFSWQYFFLPFLLFSFPW